MGFIAFKCNADTDVMHYMDYGPFFGKIQIGSRIDFKNPLWIIPIPPYHSFDGSWKRETHGRIPNGARNELDASSLTLKKAPSYPLLKEQNGARESPEMAR